MGRVNGNIQGIKDTLLERIELLYDMRQGQDEFVSREMVAELSQLTGILGREISVYIGRDGRIADVSVGDNAKVSMPNMRLVRNEDRLCGVRCIHTHPGGNSTLSGVDLQSLQRLKLDAMAAIGVDAEGRAVSVSAAFLDEPDSEGQYKLLLTKRLGVGILCTASRVGEASSEAMQAAIASMTTLNKYAAECCRKYDVHACTDVTGFSFLGHLHEMLDGAHSCRIEARAVPVFSEALRHADEFLLTAAGQRNRNHTGPFVRFENVSFSMEEVLFDPQTSGGLLVALSGEQAEALMEDLRCIGAPAAIVGEVTDSEDIEIRVVG